MLRDSLESFGDDFKMLQDSPEMLKEGLGCSGMLEDSMRILKDSTGSSREFFLKDSWGFLWDSLQIFEDFRDPPGILGGFLKDSSSLTRDSKGFLGILRDSEGF